MPALTNNYQSCELLNLGYGPGGRGPFLIRQEGSTPGSTTFQQERFLLRKDGTWVINLAVFTLSEKEQAQFLYDSSADALSVLDSLRGDPVVESAIPEGKSMEELRAAAQTTITGLWGRIQNANPSKM
ncbi:MAG: hypothetical protein ACAH88_18000 [Roseimicrobium sp.]